MSKRLTATENLARDICWGGFNTDAFRKGKTKASYWSGLPKDSKDRYCEQAAEFIWWTRRLGARRLEEAMLQHDGP